MGGERATLVWGSVVVGFVRSVRVCAEAATTGGVRCGVRKRGAGAWSVARGRLVSALRLGSQGRFGDCHALSTP